MFLKNLELYGFKSFADKTHLDFSEGITSLLGPNGCGKSNIVNAIQWVLGEQSTKTLRASRMDDVIFNGTDKRKPMQFAEVALTIDNSTHILNSDATEIEIKRRIFRNGGSNEYFLNRQQCNLRDIRDLFMDTGVGKTAYSILAQGKIDEILLQNPDQRRSLFEEAAGISRFKADSIVAERNLEKTNENIAQVEVILKETHRTYETKKTQAEKAAKARVLREQRFSLEVDVQLNSIKTYRQMQENFRKQFADSQEQLSQLQQQTKDDTDRLASLQEEMKQHGAARINCQIAQKELNTKQQGLNEQLDMLTRHYQELFLEKQQYEAKAADYKSRLDMAQEALDEQNEKMEEINDRLDEVNGRLERNKQLLLSTNAEIELENGRIGEGEQQALAFQKQLEDLQATLGQLTDVIVVQLDQKLKDSGYSAESKEQAERQFKSLLESLKQTARSGDKVSLESLERLSALFDEFVSHVPTFLDELVAPEGIIGQKHQIDSQMNEVKERIGSMREHVEELQAKLRELQGNVQLYTDAINQDNILKTELDARKNGLSALIEQMEKNNDDLKFQYADMVQSGQTATSRIGTTQDQIRDLEELGEEGKRKLAELNDTLRVEEETIGSLESQIVQIRESQNKAIDTINRLRDVVTKSQANIEALDTQVTGVYNSFFENYGKSLKEYDSRLKDDSLEDYSIIRGRLESVKKELDSMGGINQMAEDEFNDVKKQYEFLSKQMDDLEKAKSDLEGVVEDIKKRSADLFLDTYRQISQNFQELYRKLFGGGRAELRLVDPDPGKVLETGIDIFAQPPGKKLVNLTALSGGERSMTAVALLFATYMVKASPFCILDEIDAALDDRNIGNFLAVLQGFAEKSQFIIITHNKHTVLGSSSMLGVTQIEAGVSTTVSYKLARVEGKPVIMDAENKTVDFTADGKRK